MAADMATPARGSMPVVLSDDEGEEPEVLFRGRPMSPAAGKENAGNTPQSPGKGAAGGGSAVPKSPAAGGRTSPASPASLFKKRPKPLELLAAQNLMQAASPTAAARARSSARNSWVFTESPTQGSPALGSSADVMGAVLGGPAFVQAASPHRRPRDSILAFTDMSPLASTPSAAFGAATSGSLFACAPQAYVAAPAAADPASEGQRGPREGAEAPCDASSAPSDETRAEVPQAADAPPAAAAAAEAPQQPKAGGSCKKRKESILWFNDLAQQKPGMAFSILYMYSVL